MGQPFPRGRAHFTGRKDATPARGAKRVTSTFPMPTIKWIAPLFTTVLFLLAPAAPATTAAHFGERACEKILMPESGAPMVFPERRAGRARFNDPAQRGWFERFMFYWNEGRKLRRLRGGMSQYRPARGPLVLASETGTEPVKLMRIDLEIGDYLGVLRDYLQHLPELPGVNLVVVTMATRGSEYWRQIENEIPVELAGRVWITTARETHSIWAHDGSKPLATYGQTLARVMGILAASDQRLRWATQALTAVDIEVIESDLPFEGGNVVVGDFHVFMGSDIIEYMMDETGAPRSEIVAAYGRQFGKPVIEVGAPTVGGEVLQPAFHLDLFFTVARDWTRPGVHNVILLQEALGGAGDYSERLEAIAEQMRRLGFEVRRIVGQHSGAAVRITYNNVVLSGQTALVPAYFGHDNEEAFEVFRRLGYQVLPMKSSDETMRWNGAIRCATETHRAGCSLLQAP